MQKEFSMRKTGKPFILLFVVLVFLFASLISGAKPKTRKQVNIFGNMGIATSDIDEPLIDVGIEFQVAQGFFFRLVVNTHLDAGGGYYEDYYTPGYYDWYTPGIGLNDGAILHGLNTFTVFKFALSKKLKLFFQAGLNYMFYWRYDFDDAYFTWKKVKKRGFGAGFGAGFEFYLSNKLGVTVGSTYKVLFGDEPQWHPDIPSPGPPTWLKIFIGLFYRLK